MFRARLVHWRRMRSDIDRSRPDCRQYAVLDRAGRIGKSTAVPIIVVGFRNRLIDLDRTKVAKRVRHALGASRA